MPIDFTFLFSRCFLLIGQSSASKSTKIAFPVKDGLSKADLSSSTGFVAPAWQESSPWVSS